MLITTKSKLFQNKSTDKLELETSERDRNLAELDARLDRFSASRINLSIAAEKAAPKAPKP